MAELRTEYTDLRGIRHKVEHFTVWSGNEEDRERVVHELYSALEKAAKLTPP